jgi:hypothetical protein
MNPFDRLDKGVRDAFPLRDAAGRQGSPDRGGSGPPGGQGVGPGSGGTRGKILTEHDRRMLRWSIRFNTQNGADYLRQLKGLGAILAVPFSDGPKPQYKVIRDLDQRPPRLLDEDLSRINRIYWNDDKPASVAGVMEALGLQVMHPSHFVALLPPQLEQKLFELELRFKGLREDEIHETMFEVIKTARGYEPRVIDQVPKSAARK